MKYEVYSGNWALTDALHNSRRRRATKFHRYINIFMRCKYDSNVIVLSNACANAFDGTEHHIIFCLVGDAMPRVKDEEMVMALNGHFTKEYKFNSKELNSKKLRQIKY